MGLSVKKPLNVMMYFNSPQLKSRTTSGGNWPVATTDPGLANAFRSTIDVHNMAYTYNNDHKNRSFLSLFAVSIAVFFLFPAAAVVPSSLPFVGTALGRSQLISTASLFSNTKTMCPALPDGAFFWGVRSRWRRVCPIRGIFGRRV